MAGPRDRVEALSESPGPLPEIKEKSDFGLWSFRFPLVLVRTGRRLPVQALGERRVFVSVTCYPRGGAPDRGEAPRLPEIKEKSGMWNLVPVG